MWAVELAGSVVGVDDVDGLEVVVKGAVVFCDLEENFGVFDAGFDFEAVADDLFVV